jgi:carbon-monoxide dehydrogenase large subunit/6-hydroxypseudooxynicotine dehydrogenase subunit gamma
MLDPQTKSGRQDVLGASVPRLEDAALVTGTGRFVGDISFPHQLHMRIVRSPRAHGRILAIDTEAPTADLIWVVSAVSREVNSPVRAVSKNGADSATMWPNTADRKSATTRSPSVVTR